MNTPALASCLARWWRGSGLHWLALIETGWPVLAAAAVRPSHLVAFAQREDR